MGTSLGNKGLGRRQVVQGIGLGLAASSLSRFAFAAAPPAAVDVVVIGAGLAGLQAATLLKAKGLNVAVLEGNERIGGRVFTYDGLYGRPEGGTIEIASGYTRFLAAAKANNIELVDPPANEFGDSILNIGGQFVPTADWAASPVNKLQGAEREVQPAQLLAKLLGENPVKTDADWLKPEFKQYDVPLAELLKKKNVSAEALRLIDIGGDFNDVATVSALHVYRTMFHAAAAGTRSVRVKGGTMRVPDAMAKALGDAVQLGKLVTSIKSDKVGVTIGCDDHSSYKAKFVVIAVPPPALRQIKIEPGLPAPRAAALKALNMTRVTQAHLYVRKPFTNEDKMPPGMWTDSPIERVTAANPENGIYRRLIVSINGKGAETIDKLQQREAKAWILEQIGKVRPSTQGGAVEVMAVNSWGASLLAGGAYPDWTAGQITKLAPGIGATVGRLFFAGDYTSVNATGMEGALESGERVAQEILSKGA